MTTSAAEVWGPDVSDYQGTVDWHSVRADGASFAVAKATEGLHYTAATFARNWAGMKAAGLIRGAYHFGHPANDPIAEANHFLAVVGHHLLPGDFVALDIEANDGRPADQVARWVGAFAAHVTAVLGVDVHRVWIYTGAWFWNPKAGGSSIVAAHPLWLSGYTNGEPPPATGFGHWTAWQYTDHRTVRGIAHPVDASRFNGTLDQLRRLVGLAVPPMPPAKPSPPPAKPPTKPTPPAKPATPPAKPAPKPKPAGKPHVPPFPGSQGFRLGATGPAVTAARVALGTRAISAPVDADFLKRVKAFQRIRPHLWPADGIIGPRTYGSLMASRRISSLYRR